MNSSSYIDLALKMFDYSQKELAQKLEVSPTQISKWKKGEYISYDMQNKFNTLLGLDKFNPEFVLLAGSIENAKKWDKLIQFIAESARDSAETGYETTPLYDEMELLSYFTFTTIEKMGVKFPKDFPKELDLNFDTEYSGDDLDEEIQIEYIFDTIDDHPISSLIYEIFLALNDVYGFYTAYISDFMYDDDLNLEATNACNIEPCLIELAASKIEKPLDSFAPNFIGFKFETERLFEKWIGIVKEKVMRANIPLHAELMNLVHNSHEKLGHEAEAESLGVNKRRIHPDIYMNELLTGMRVIHQVLPVILKKMEIYDEFQIDDADLRINRD